MRVKKRKTVRRCTLFVCLPLLLCGVIVGTVLLRPYLTGRDADALVVPEQINEATEPRLIAIRRESEGLIPGEVVDLMAGVQPGTPAATQIDMTAGNTAAMDFAVRLLQASLQGENNTLIAPLSALMALGMVASGAAGETKTQMATALGISPEALNDYMAAARALFTSDENVRLDLFNALWIDGQDDFAVNADFLQTNADCYDADAYFVPENESMAAAINAWVSEKTDGLIDRITEEADGRMWLTLVNVLLFEAEWERVWGSVAPEIFYFEDGTRKTLDMMQDEDDAFWVRDGAEAQGLVKFYRGGAYAFVALKPNGDVPLADYVASLTGERLAAVMQDYVRADQRMKIDAAMPYFSQSADLSLKNALSAMGMPAAFDVENADFSGIGRFGERDTHEISEIRQKTSLTVDLDGTVGVAATEVGMYDGFSITLNRSFVYMIVHVETGAPIFMGAMMDPTAAQNTGELTKANYEIEGSYLSSHNAEGTLPPLAVQWAEPINTLSYQDNAAPREVTVEFEGRTHTGTYRYTEHLCGYPYPTHRYENDDVYFEINNGELRGWGLRPSDDWRGDLTGQEALSQCGAVADAFAERYLSLDAYKRSYEHADNCIVFTYTRRIIPYAALDGISVSVSLSGLVVGFAEINPGSLADVTAIKLDKTQLSTVIEDRLNGTGEAWETYSIDYHPPLLMRLSERELVLFYNIYVYLPSTSGQGNQTINQKQVRICLVVVPTEA